MRAVTTTTTRVAHRLRTAALAAALACVSNGAYAAFASVVIDDLFVAATPDSASSFLFAPTDTMFQFWDLRTFFDGAQTGIASSSVNDWSNVDATTTNPRADATVSSLPGTLPDGQPTTTFNLSASATSSGLVYAANGLMYAAGSYCFYDADLDPNGLFDGTSAFCTGSGSLDFFLQYDLNATKGFGTANPSAYAELDWGATGLGSSFDIASTVLNLASKLDQQLAWTATLGASEQAGFFLQGIVDVQAIPEPGALTLAALGLIGFAATRRRHSRAAS